MILSNRNSWRVERADRAAVLIDAASYFGALRKSLIKARSTVFVVGWDIDSRTRLVGENGRADDGYPETFIDLLSALVNERRNSTCISWSGIIPCCSRWNANSFPRSHCVGASTWRIRYCLDDDLPAGAAS